MAHLEEEKVSLILLGLCSSSPMTQHDSGIAAAVPGAAPWRKLSALLAELSVAPNPPRIAAETSKRHMDKMYENRFAFNVLFGLNKWK